MLLNRQLKRNFIHIVFSQIFVQINSKIFLCSELDPYIDSWLFLDVTNDWIELKIFFSFVWLNYLETHWNLTFVVKNQFLSVYVVQQTNLKVIQLFLNSNWNLSASPYNSELYWGRMHKIAYINLEFALEYSNLRG